MITGLITLTTTYIVIGIGLNILKDDTNETSRTVVKLVKESFDWPKKLYNTWKKD